MKNKLTTSLVVLVLAVGFFMIAADGGGEIGLFYNGYEMYGFWFTVLWSLFGSVCFGIGVFAVTAFKSIVELEAKLDKLNKEFASDRDWRILIGESLEAAIVAFTTMSVFLAMAMKFIVCHVQGPNLWGEFGGWVLPLSVSLTPTVFILLYVICARFREGLSCLALVGVLALFYLCLWVNDYRLSHWVIPYLEPNVWHDIAYDGGSEGEGYDIQALPKEALSVSGGQEGLIIEPIKNSIGQFELGKPSIKVSAKQKCTIYNCDDVLLEEGADATCLSCSTVRAVAGSRVKASGCSIVIAMPGSVVEADGCRIIIRMPGATVHQTYSANEVNMKVVKPFVPRASSRR